MLLFIKNMRELLLIAGLYLVVLAWSPLCYSAQLENVKVLIDPTQIVAPVNKLVLGNNVISNKEGRNSNFFKSTGGGLWDPVERRVNKEVAALIEMAGITALRWPGGSWPKQMNFSSLVGSVDKRPNNKFGLSEFLLLCDGIGAIPLITLPTDEKRLSQISDLLEYLNAPDDNSNPGGGIDWAHRRAEDGRKRPWSVSWFEFGNETFNTDITPEQYIDRYLRVYAKMISIDPGIKLGAVMDDTDNMRNGWTEKVLRGVGDKAGFLSIHPYFPKIGRGEAKRIPRKTLALSALASDGDFSYRIAGYNKLIREITKRNDLHLVASEYNGHFVQQEPLPFRFSLVNAIHNADTVRLMLEPESNIAMANYWQLNNSYWGMLQQNKDLKGKFFKQANYYVYVLYNKFLGDNLVHLVIDSPTYEFEGVVGIGERTGKTSESDWVSYAGDIPAKWKLSWGSDARHDQVNGRVVVDFDGDEDVNYYHAYKTIKVKPNTLYRIDVKARTENLYGGKIGIAVEDARGWNKTHYQPKNIQLSGTTKWQWVSGEIRTLPDAEAIKIMVRRISGKGKISGKAYFDEVRIMEKTSNLGSVQSVVGTASISEDGGFIYLILINKQLDNSANVQIRLPDEYQPVGAEAMFGESAYSMNMPVARNEGVRLIKADWQEKDGYVYFNLSPLSMTGIQFERQ